MVLGAADAHRHGARGKTIARALRALGLGAALLLVAISSANAAPAKVALVHQEESTPLQQRTITRLRAELGAAGFEVIEVERRGEAARDAAEAPIDVPGVFATISISSSSPDSADIWVADRITNKTVVRRVKAPAGRDVAKVLAVRAVELLQASLLEALEREPRESRDVASGPDTHRPSDPRAAPNAAGEAVPPPEPATLPPDVATWLASRRAEPETARFGLQAGLGWLQAFGGMGGAILPMFGLSYRLLPQFSAALRLGGTAVATEVSSPVGTESIRQAMAWLEGRYEPLGSTGAVVPAILLGGGAYRLDIIGTASAPYQGTTDGLTAAVATAGGSARFQLGTRVAIVGAARLFWIAPQPILLAAGTEVGTAGRPSLLVDAMVDVTF